ncbi:MAG TPA: hypothetical protein VKN99_00245 [Polyangia bacterium]|nr:hypothetical protein [Polyangia bacterium]
MPPVAAHFRELAVAPVVAVDDDVLALNGLPVERLREELRALRLRDPRLDALVVLAAARVDFGRVRGVLGAARAAGFDHVALVVRPR